MSASIPTVKREDWPKHPRFPAQALLLGSHANFRRISRQLIDAAKSGESLERIGAYYAAWIAAMRSHEAYEEHKAYPYLAKRWGVSFADATEGHHELHRRDRAVREAFLLRDERAPDAREDIVSTLEAHDVALHDHLDLEEEQVIPLLLELSPDEFRRYSYSPIDTLLAELGDP